ncbi:MAG: DUF433 domain-containing protein [Candidatus Acidiferrales bacterium]
MPALDCSQCPAAESVPGRVSGAWVFRGTRMPVATVFENLEAGASVEDVKKQKQIPHAIRARRGWDSLRELRAGGMTALGWRSR